MSLLFSYVIGMQTQVIKSPGVEGCRDPLKMSEIKYRVSNILVLYNYCMIELKYVPEN